MSGMLPPSGPSPKDPKAPDELPISSVSQGNYLKAIDLFIHVTHIYCKLNVWIVLVSNSQQKRQSWPSQSLRSNRG